ncbi:MAG: cob(I)yrinic acid a,c-diamide adenosyltransferase [Fidelibacterota bacterium]
MRITKVYTRTGDDGSTSLAKGERVSKNSHRIRTLGSLDETNSGVGVALAQGVAEELRQPLKQVQNVLLNVGGELAVADQEITLVSEKEVKSLEEMIDRLNRSLPPLKEFILPGGSPASAALHHARSVCRRAERNLVALGEGESINPHSLAYVNRLSDFLFVAARYQNKMDGGGERMWER